MTSGPTPLPKSSNNNSKFQSRYSYDLGDDAWLSRKINVDAMPPKITPFAVLTWNIDFVTNRPALRLRTTLSHLESILSPALNTPPPPPTFILFQEFHRGCFPALLSHSFVRSFYEVSDTSADSWTHTYGTVTLIPKSMAGNATVFRTKFSNSKMGRDALYVDCELSAQTLHSGLEGTAPNIKIRIANTHLESLSGHGDRSRPVQLKSIAQFLTCTGIHGGLVGGDMNPISLSDANLPEKVGLVDAWKTLQKRNIARPNAGGVEMSEKQRDDEIEKDPEGHTWGYQPTSRYPPRRFDKVLFAGNLRVDSVTRLGVGLTYTEPNAALMDTTEEEDITEDDDDPLWVSDHYAVLAAFTVTA